MTVDGATFHVGGIISIEVVFLWLGVCIVFCVTAVSDTGSEFEEMEQEEPTQSQYQRDFSPGRRKKYQKPTTIIYVKACRQTLFEHKEL